MTEPVEGGDPLTRRGLRILVALTVVFGGGLLALSASNGGRAGLTGLLLGTAFASALTSLYAVLTGARDVFLSRPVGRSRYGLAAATFIATPMLFSMVASLGG